MKMSWHNGAHICDIIFLKQKHANCRYANLLRTGADEFKLDKRFRDWLHSIPTVSSDSKRGNEYWQGLNGEPLKMYPRIWSGTDKKRCGRILSILWGTLQLPTSRRLAVLPNPANYLRTTCTAESTANYFIF